MKGDKSSRQWVVNVLSAVLLTLAAFTGFINWLILPGRHGVGEGFLFTLRHFFMGVHRWAAVAFVVVIVIHALLHKNYIKAHLKARGILK